MIDCNELRGMVLYGMNKNYSHVIICCDTFSYEYYPHYVKYDEDIHKAIRDIQSESVNMVSLMEVYNYNLDIDKQLKESRAYHVYPICEPKKEHDQPTNEAYLFAKNAHKGQTRIDGTPYINHPMKVADYVTKYKKSKNIDDLINSAYLHDTIEDTSVTYYDICKKFGATVASLVLELTTDEDMKRELGKTKYLEIKMKNMSSWALVIKLCDRLSNICDLDKCSESFRNKYIKETVTIINFLVENRELSKTHIEIIKNIVNKIYELRNLYTNNDIEFDIFKRKIYSL